MRGSNTELADVEGRQLSISALSSLDPDRPDAHERRYHGLFHALCILALAGKGPVLSEVPNALGRSDLVIDLPEVCWIFEMRREATDGVAYAAPQVLPEGSEGWMPKDKRDTDTAKALEQMKRKRYENQWEGRRLPDGTEKPISKVAVTFGTAERNIVAWAEDDVKSG